MKLQEVSNSREYREWLDEIVGILEDELEGETENEIQEEIFYSADQYAGKGTPANLSVLQYSRNNPREWKHLVDESDSWRMVIQVMAFDVLRQDFAEKFRESHSIDY
jgi:hypothetical protein